MCAGLSEYAARKGELLGALRGRVLEIGAGVGANYGFFSRDIEWLGLEPDADRRRRLTVAAARRGHHAPVIAGLAEHLPLPDRSVDAVAGTLVLCSVTDLSRVLAEIRRVLRPGGSFVFAEHVAAPRWTCSRLLQRLLAPLSRRFDAGCDPRRDTLSAIRSAGFAGVTAAEYVSRPGLGVYTHYICGIARA